MNNVNFKAIEKAWFKPKKDEIKVNLDLKGIKNLENYITDLDQNRYVLDVLEEWLQSMIIIYENEYKDIDVSDHYRCVLYKIQELKKEMK